MAVLLRNLLAKSSAGFAQIEILHNYPALQLALRNGRFFNTSVAPMSKGSNAEYTISPVYHNRNPRNLEKLAFARKRVGWKFQSPRKDFYHKLVLQRSSRHTSGLVEHCSGKVVLTASTMEHAISSQLSSLTDVSACENVGRVLAQRCLESGITAVFFDEDSNQALSERVSIFLQAFKDLEISLTEPDMIVPDFRPGVNYDGYNRYAEPKVWKENYQDV